MFLVSTFALMSCISWAMDNKKPNYSPNIVYEVSSDGDEKYCVCLIFNDKGERTLYLSQEVTEKGCEYYLEEYKRIKLWNKKNSNLKKQP